MRRLDALSVTEVSGDGLDALLDHRNGCGAGVRHAVEARCLVGRRPRGRVVIGAVGLVAVPTELFREKITEVGAFSGTERGPGPIRTEPRARVIPVAVAASSQTRHDDRGPPAQTTEALEHDVSLSESGSVVFCSRLQLEARFQCAELVHHWGQLWREQPEMR